MLIGSWGPIIFTVSAFGALTFSELTQDSSGRWVTHEPINTPPVSEFLGPGQDEAEIKIVLTRMLGVDPMIGYELLRQLVRGGKNYPLILGGIPLSGNMWYIETLNGDSSKFTAMGQILWTEVTCKFKEYH